MIRDRFRRFATMLVVVLAVSTSASAQESMTIEQLLSSPFPGGLIAAPHHGKIAWTMNTEGRRNLWVALAPEYQARSITRYQEDDGQELTDLQFGPGGNHIVYVRGGAPNREGEIPNPESDPDGMERSIWIVEAAGGEPKRLAEGSGPAISPDGERIAFLRGGQIWIVPSVHAGEPDELTHTRGRASGLRWAPGGEGLVFVSDRGDHSFIGFYDEAAKTVRYLDPGLGRDSNPTFSPDGSELAFIRIPNERGNLPFEPRRSAIPWSIRLVEVATGVGRLVWKAEEGRGSAFQGVVSESQLHWGDSDRLIFPWERDGWTHLYAVARRGGRALLLTPGEFEVEDVFITSDRKEILFSSNQDDIDRRHLWRVSVTGGAPEPLTSGKGIEWSPVMTGDGSAIAYLASDTRRPAHPVLRMGTESRPLATSALPANFPREALVEPEAVVFPGADGMPIHGQLFAPRSASEARHPAVVFFHGGSRRQMLLGWHYRGYYHNAYALNQYLASRGYVVLSVNYRSGIGYGMEFRDALNYGARGASEFNDVLGAGLYLRSRNDVDPDRIGLWGGSYGGYLTALGLARASDLFAAGVDLHGVHDWNVVVRNFVPTYDAAKRQEFAALAFASSPMSSIDGWRSPVLLIHGDDDRNVPFSESVDLAEALAARGVDYEELVFPDEVHGFLLHRNWLAAYRAAADFFERKLESPRKGTDSGLQN